jgi:hypothetical protein
MKPRFLLDENVDRAVQRQLRRLDAAISVLLIGDHSAPPKGTLDHELLLWLEANGYILITNDRSTMPEHLVEHYRQAHHIPGIFWLRPNASIGEVIETLHLIWVASDASEYMDRMLYIPL